MSWLSIRDNQNSGGYRYIQFEGGRILQAVELNDLQKEQTARKRYANSSMFAEGATANVKVTVAGNGLTLSKAVPSEPNMLVLINGEWEPFTDTTLLLPSAKASGADPLYLHWVLWRVTADGAAGSIADPSLVDQVTNEVVSERGQLQFAFSFAPDLSASAIDSARMIDKSFTPIPVALVSWNNFVASASMTDTWQPHSIATNAQAGVVKLSTETAGGVAVANDDPRLGGSGVPDGSLKTRHVAPVELTGATTSIQTQEVKTGTSDGGIDCAKSWYAPLKARVSDVLTYMSTKLTALAATLDNHAGRISTLESRSADGGLSNHIGKDLGRTADGGFTHKPVVTDTTDGFKHIGPQYPAAGLNSLTQVPPAFMSWSQDGHKQGGIVQNGDYVLLNQGMVNLIDGLAPGAELNSYFKLALMVGQLSIAVRDLQNR